MEKTGKNKKETDKDKINMRTETFSTGNRHSVQTKSEAGTFAEVMAETELL
jgi:hypothetical protein